MDSIKAYINPVMFQAELKARGESTSMSFEKENVEFHQHSRTGAMFGTPELSPEMEKAVAAFYQRGRDSENQGQQVDLKQATDVNDDEVLGG